jgi:prepilin-type N-terminal cleavage/methylation domain-containing protein
MSILQRRAVLRHRPGGFTIIEVLATITLAAIVLPAVIHGVLLCLSTAGHARNRLQASSLAQSKLAEIVVAGEFLDAESNGDFGEAFSVFTWKARVSEWEDSRLVQIEVLVEWTRIGKRRHVALTTLAYTGTPNG